MSAFLLHPGGINTNLQRHLGPLLKWIGWLVMTLALYLPFCDIKTVPQARRKTTQFNTLMAP